MLILEPGTVDSYTTIRKQLTMNGTIGRVGPQEWQRREWPDSGRLHLVYTERELTSFTAAGSALQLTNKLAANHDWVDAAATGSALFVVVPPESSTIRNQAGNRDPIGFLLADLAQSHRLTAGLTTATRQLDVL
ncbi:hypothetical protein ACFCV3_32090 [Kribbella sp. NPDC056345]|uniref:hypothetical protein n=1 Tax=Kribbella sp. NPDC056345 TaxID=3345789 RepID=UPI0035E17DB3